MSAFVVYLDHEHAKVFKMIPAGSDQVKMDRREIRHHQNNEASKLKDHNKFFHEVAGELGAASEILIVGHGTAKQEFVHHLENHHHADIKKKVVGVEAVDHPTDNQILALARKFFKKQHLFT
jgi:bisphosphoglycerate-dependent phosphoglycerate mutase